MAEKVTKLPGYPQVAIDCTNYKVIARSNSGNALGNLAFIQFANVDVMVMPCTENKYFSVFTFEQLRSIFLSAGGSDADFPDATYSAALRATREIVLNAAHLNLPFTDEQLEEQAQCIDFEDDKPYAFNPKGNKPTRLKAWHWSPQRNRPRTAKPEAFQLQPKGPPAPPERDPNAPAPAPAPSKRTRSPRAEKSAAGPAKRPAAGSKTAFVWDTADACKAANPKLDHKALRKLVIETCIKAGTNKSTASVQFALWAGSQN